jgi:hypothetical protein
MATENTIKDELDALVKQFQSLPSHADKCDFLHDNPKLQQVISTVHFPKPTTKSTPTTI